MSICECCCAHPLVIMTLRVHDDSMTFTRHLYELVYHIWHMSISLCMLVREVVGFFTVESADDLPCCLLARHKQASCSSMWWLACNWLVHQLPSVDCICCLWCRHCNLKVKQPWGLTWYCFVQGPFYWYANMECLLCACLGPKQDKAFYMWWSSGIWPHRHIHGIVELTARNSSLALVAGGLYTCLPGCTLYQYCMWLLEYACCHCATAQTCL